MGFLASALLLAQVAATPTADISLDRTPGPAAEYVLGLVSKSQHEAVRIMAKYKESWKEGGIASFQALDFEMVAGNAPTGLQPFEDLELKTTENGLAIDPDVAGMNLVYSIHRLCAFVPNKALEPGQRFPIDAKGGASTLVGEGRFVGWEPDGKLARLRLDAVYAPLPDMPKLEAKLDTWFDVKRKRVVRASGTVASLEMRKGSVSRTEMELSLEAAS
jgi:hypothetical protein